MNPRLVPLAAAIALAFPCALQAQQAATLDPVVVTATRQPTRTSELLSDVTVVERKDIDEAGQSTLEEILGRQPGIQVIANGAPGANSSLFMRGTSSNQVLLLIDGVRVGSATAGSPAWSRIPTSQIERIEILRGPASSLYGADAVGGVVQVFTRRGGEGFSPYAEIGAGSYDTYRGNAGFAGGAAGWRYALNAATDYSKGFNSTRNPGPRNFTYNADRDGFRQNSVTGSLAYAFAKGHEAGANIFYSSGENRYDAGTPGDDRNDQVVSTYSAYLRDAFTDNWTSTLRAGRSTDDAENTRNGVRTSTFKTSQNQYLWQNDIATGFGNFLAALERLEQDVDSTTAYTVTSRSINSAMAGWRGQFAAHRLQANVRIDDNSQFGDKTTGSIAYGYQFSEAWRANVGYGTAFKAPTFNDLYFPLSFGFRGNPNLKPESSRNAEAAVHWESGLQHVSLTLYRNDVSDLITFASIPGTFDSTMVNISSALIKGATLAYDGRVGSFVLGASYDYLDPRNEDTDKLLPRRAKQYGTLALGQQEGPFEWRVEMQASDYRYDNVANTRKVAGYAIFNVYGAYRLARDWSVFARVNNLFDRDYELVADYATAGLNAFVGLRYALK
ncbi:MAG: TonB-dependent receptor [Betaproteobacteria bacterium]|nr:TonB-dependent receptor [Betaproteobacteria bacterium]